MPAGVSSRNRGAGVATQKPAGVGEFKTMKIITLGIACLSLAFNLALIGEVHRIKADGLHQRFVTCNALEEIYAKAGDKKAQHILWIRKCVGPVVAEQEFDDAVKAEGGR
jgi:hypothetical protein